MMTIDEKYEFDLNGYIIYRNFLPQEDVKLINSIIEDAKGAKDNGKFSFFQLDPCFMELLAHPRAIGILSVMLGDWLRFDHAFGIEMNKAASVLENLHAGQLKNQGAFWYQWFNGQMQNGLIKVIYALNDVNPGDGGFICIPGSHKSNLSYHPKHDSHLVINPALKAGDMLIFTEALVHGSAQWQAERTRRVLIYSYAPGCLAWKSYETVKPYLSMATTDLQRDLLRPPCVSAYNEHLGQQTGEWPTERRSPLNLPRLESPRVTQARDTIEQVKKSVRRSLRNLRVF